MSAEIDSVKQRFIENPSTWCPRYRARKGTRRFNPYGFITKFGAEAVFGKGGTNEIVGANKQ